MAVIILNVKIGEKIITATINTTNINIIEAIKAIVALDPKETTISCDESETYPLREAPSVKEILADIANMPQHEQDTLRAEVRAEMYGKNV